MKKRIIIIAGILILIGAAVVFAAAVPKKFSKEAMRPSDYHIGIEYAKAMKADKPFVGLFYTDWCTYCIRFMPKFKALSKVYKKDYNFVMINAEAPENEALCKDIVLTGFPTVYVFDPKIDNRFLINNGLYMRTDLLRVELDRYLRVRKLIKFD